MKRVFIFLLALSFNTSANESFEALRQSLSKHYQISIDTISESEIKGLYQITSGPIVLYGTMDGRYIFLGNLIDLSLSKQMDKTEEKRKQLRIQTLLGIKDLITYNATTELKSHIWIFTDIDCGYSRKLHMDIPHLNQNGIEVRYVLLSRHGPQSTTFKKSVAVWCDQQQNKALNHVMKGQEISQLNCSNPMDKYHDLGEKFGITGTPTVVFADGTFLPGYIKYKELIKLALDHVAN